MTQRHASQRPALEARLEVALRALRELPKLRHQPGHGQTLDDAEALLKRLRTIKTINSSGLDVLERFVSACERRQHAPLKPTTKIARGVKQSDKQARVNDKSRPDQTTSTYPGAHASTLPDAAPIDTQQHEALLTRTRQSISFMVAATSFSRSDELRRTRKLLRLRSLLTQLEQRHIPINKRVAANLAATLEQILPQWALDSYNARPPNVDAPKRQALIVTEDPQILREQARIAAAGQLLLTAARQVLIDQGYTLTQASGAIASSSSARIQALLSAQLQPYHTRIEMKPGHVPSEYLIGERDLDLPGLRVHSDSSIAKLASESYDHNLVHHLQIVDGRLLKMWTSKIGEYLYEERTAIPMIGKQHSRVPDSAFEYRVHGGDERLESFGVGAGAAGARTEAQRDGSYGIGSAFRDGNGTFGSMSAYEDYGDESGPD